MTVSYSYSTTESFTLTHAKKLAAKVIADMHQCHRLYGRPVEASIADFHEELIVLLAGEYLATYEFGFQTAAEKRVLTWRYRVTAAGDLEGGRSGGLYATADVSGTYWFNYVTRTQKWWNLTPAQRDAVDAQHPITRTTGDGPTDGAGRWVSGTRNYVSGGVALAREEFQPW